MHTVLITLLLLAVAAAVYLAMTLRDGVAAARCGWGFLVDPRKTKVPRWLRMHGAALWATLVLGFLVLGLLWARF